MSITNRPTLRRSSSSANITWYGTPESDLGMEGSVWCEVLRWAPLGRDPEGTPVDFSISIRRQGIGEVARVKYVPKRAPQVLPDRTVTRLVRAALAEQEKP